MARSAGLLDQIVEGVPLDGHDGRSGARLDRVVLADGSRLVVKRTSPAVDLSMRLTGLDESREYQLWQAGVLDSLPAGLGHALVSAWREGDETVLVMRDLGDAVVGWGRRLSRDECQRLLAAWASLHREFRDHPPEGLVPLADRVSLFAPARMAPEAAAGSQLPVAVLRGWERFAAAVDGDIAEAVFGVLDRPERLAGPLGRRPSTFVHGDPWLVNVAIEARQITLLDWDLATWAPPALDLALFLDGSLSQVDATPDVIVDDFRRLWGDEHDEIALRLALFAGLADLGWNKALDAAEHDDPEVRQRQQEELDWWVTQAGATLEEGLIDE